MNLWKESTSAQGELMGIIKKLFYSSASQEFTVEVVDNSIPGVDNSISDALSHFQICRFQTLACSFRTLAPRADQYPTTVTQDIWQVCLSK